MSEYPDDILKAAEEALDNLLCNCVESCGGNAGLRKASIEEIAKVLLADRQRDPWRPIETAPKNGFFLIHSPDHPGIPLTVKAEIFHSGIKAGTPRHLSFNHFKHWMPLPSAPKVTPT